VCLKVNGEINGRLPPPDFSSYKYSKDVLYESHSKEVDLEK